MNYLHRPIQYYAGLYVIGAVNAVCLLVKGYNEMCRC